MNKNLKTYRLIIKGKVQEVGFRYWFNNLAKLWRRRPYVGRTWAVRRPCVGRAYAVRTPCVRRAYAVRRPCVGRA